jgi:hypothetical protein
VSALLPGALCRLEAIPHEPLTPAAVLFGRRQNLRLTYGILNLSGTDCIGDLTSAGIVLGARKSEW